jgi:hypothetical protein
VAQPAGLTIAARRAAGFAPSYSPVDGHIKARAPSAGYPPIQTALAGVTPAQQQQQQQHAAATSSMAASTPVSPVSPVSPVGQVHFAHPHHPHVQRRTWWDELVDQYSSSREQS